MPLPRCMVPTILLLVSLRITLAAPAALAGEGGLEPHRIRDRVLPHDASLPVPRLDGPARLTAGERRWIRWRPPGPEVEELELLLSLDDGRRFVLRVSPELPGAEDRYEWRVPNLAAARARLRLRMRIEGREVESEIGAPFTIEADLERPIDYDLVHEGTWWAGPGRGGWEAKGALGEPCPEARLGARTGASACEAPPRVPLSAFPAVRAFECTRLPVRGHSVCPRSASFRPPRGTPLRA